MLSGFSFHYMAMNIVSMSFQARSRGGGGGVGGVPTPPPPSGINDIHNYLIQERPFDCF